jgi:acyl-coenzyme A synthetase/AMP-(fatty) acid ligase
MLLSSQKFEGKAEEVLKEKLETPPKHIRLEKKMGDSEPIPVTLEGSEDGEGGMMLYTSGTTNRPVCFSMA